MVWVETKAELKEESLMYFHESCGHKHMPRYNNANNNNVPCQSTNTTNHKMLLPLQSDVLILLFLLLFVDDVAMFDLFIFFLV